MILEVTPWVNLYILEVTARKTVHFGSYHSVNLQLRSFHMGDCTFWKLSLGFWYILEVITWVLIHFGSYHLGFYTFWKLSLGFLYILEVITWVFIHFGSYHLGYYRFWKLSLGLLYNLEDLLYYTKLKTYLFFLLSFPFLLFLILCTGSSVVVSSSKSGLGALNSILDSTNISLFVNNCFPMWCALRLLKTGFFNQR